MEIELIGDGFGYEPALLRRGLYLQQIEHYLRFFDPSQLKIIGFKEFLSDIPATLNAVCKFVGAKQFSWSRFQFHPWNARDYWQSMKQ
jgi:hypothetical protein